MRGTRTRPAPLWSRRTWLVALLALAVVLAVGILAVGCGDEEETATTAQPATTAAQPATTEAQPATTAAPPTTVAEKTELILASTTSTQDSGLFDVLIPAFETEYPYTVKVIAVGSGEAIAMGESGDADVLLVHSPAAEKTFMEEGFGIERKAVMYNDFVIVGPAADPASVKGLTDAAAAFKAIAGAESLFFSRGDDSGTHSKEKAIWKAATMEPAGDWYQTTGQGMGETLTIADQQSGYTLSDRATYLTKSGSLALKILVEGDKVLFNQYHVITVKDAVNAQGAADFMAWIVSDAVQQDLIATFGAEKFGQPLFVPNAGLVE